MKCSLSNAYTSSDQRRDNPQEWYGLTRDHTVLPATHTFIHEWNEPMCIHFVSIYQMAPREQGNAYLDQLTIHLSTSKG